MLYLERYRRLRGCLSKVWKGPGLLRIIGFTGTKQKSQLESPDLVEDKVLWDKLDLPGLSAHCSISVSTIIVGLGIKDVSQGSNYATNCLNPFLGYPT